MRVVPENQSEKITFFKVHLAPFSANATAIGTTPAAVADLAAKTEAARAAYGEAQRARDAARSATLKLKIAMEAMEVAGASIIQQVRAQAQVTGDNSIYSLAQIPAPAAPSPVGAPGRPYEFKSTLRQNGSLGLTWKCKNPRECVGVIYQVYRKVGQGGEYTYLGGTGKKRFSDNTVPAGAAQISYRIQATRSTSVGDVVEFLVNFGGSRVGAPAPVAAKIAA